MRRNLALAALYNLIAVPVALLLGLLGLAAFIWALRTGQFADPRGAAERILDEDDINTT